VKDNTISFELSNPRKLSIEINGSVHRALNYFLTQLNLIRQKLMILMWSISVQGYMTRVLYGWRVQKGLYCRWSICLRYYRGSEINNVTVAGRGILCCSKSPLHSKNGISIRNCTGLKLYDFIMLDPSSWMIRIDGCKNVSVNQYQNNRQPK